LPNAARLNFEVCDQTYARWYVVYGGQGAPTVYVVKVRIIKMYLCDRGEGAKGVPVP
jgi:hypothetical protein